MASYTYPNIFEAPSDGYIYVSSSDLRSSSNAYKFIVNEVSNAKVPVMMIVMDKYSTFETVFVKKGMKFIYTNDYYSVGINLWIWYSALIN